MVLCDGEGRNGVWLATRGHQVVSVDWSKVAVEKSRKLATAKKVDLETHVCSIKDFVSSRAAEGPWDAIVAIFCQLPQPDWQLIADKLVTNLSTKGTLILEEFTPAQLQMNSGGPSSEQLTLTRVQLKKLFGCLLLETKVCERRIFEGRQHRGLSSVLQVLGHVKPGWLSANN